MIASRVMTIVALVVTAWIGSGLAAVSAARESSAVMSVTPANASIGGVLRVDLASWPQGNVTAAVCGNSGQRGSTDCDLIGAGSIRIPASGSESLTVTVQAPPVGCPCVVRAALTDGSVVRIAPISIAGVPEGVNIPAAAGPASTREVRVTASIETADVDRPETWWPAFGGPAHKVLVLAVHNRSLGTVSGLRVVGEVGHVHSQEGQPLGAAVPDVAAGETRVVRVPFTVTAPVYGTYSVHGTVYGLAAPLTFHLTTKSEPWALELAVPLSLLLIAQYVRRRERVRRRNEAARSLEAVDALTAPVEFSQCSPGVGVEDDLYWQSSSYDRRGMGADRSAVSSASSEEQETVLVEGRRG
jgi:hypothetical protein